MKNQLALLEKLGAPDALIASFREVCRINSQLPSDLKERSDVLLEKQCRKFAFHDILHSVWFFRPYTLGGGDNRPDTPVSGTEPEAAAIEQAYRRGYSQGFAECRRLVEDASTLADIKKKEELVDNWRRRSVQKFGTPPPSDEQPPHKPFGD